MRNENKNKSTKELHSEQSFMNVYIFENKKYVTLNLIDWQ